jgi:glyoxylase-like metal-dependent hydrolase (beta-lactamase superfamily II)
LASAERLYGDKLNYLWGEIVPVPEQNVRVLSGGETVHGMRVAYTPGHASHHVCYLHEDSGTAFVGDVAACRIPPSNVIVPPTPPPDIDIETWEESLDTVAGWSPQRLALTHFGSIDEDVPGHIEKVRAKLREEAELARRMPKEEYDADNEARIRRALAEEGIEGDTVDELLQAVPIAYQWGGLDRYWRKKAESEAAAQT